MSKTRLLALSHQTRGLRGLVAAIIAFGALLLAPSSADALSVTVTMPTPVTVGQTGLTAHVVLTNTQQLAAGICAAGTCNPASEGIIFIPSCGSAATPAPTCSLPDPGVFTFAASAPVLVGSCGALITSFNVVVADAVQGKLRLEPVGAPLVLGASGTPQATCDIPLPFSVTKLPATDAVVDVPGVQTYASASADAQLATGGKDPGTGRGVTTVNPGTTQPLPPPPIQPPPPPPPVQPPPPPPVIQPNDLDHFKCYEALQSNFRQRTVGTRDQFGQRRTRVLRTRQLCNPVSKNGGKVLQPRAHLVCYETRDTGNPTPARTVVVTNQFGQRKLNVLRPNRLCVPSLKRKTAGAVPTGPNPTKVLDHFRCYDVQQQPAPQTVKLADQFGTTATKVLRVIRLCNPVRKNNEPVRRAKSHLVCYSIQDAQAFRALAVRVRNQFGLAGLRIRRPETLCLPSFKEV
ncbi:MAG: hypothetical protein QOD37_711, partial [Gaiellales bacterium]|nr:hypothetical protein [Gaiellales bacterium]